MIDALETRIRSIAASARPFSSGGSRDTNLEFAQLISRLEGVPMSTGWPDFAIFGKDHQLKAVAEVKPAKGRTDPRQEQLVMLKMFASLGVLLFMWLPSYLLKIDATGNTERVDPSTLKDLL